jgi:hypothetical protein
MRRNEAGRKDDLTPELENQRAIIIKDIHYRIITRRNLDCKVALASVGCEINNTIRMIITIIYLSVSCKTNYRTEFLLNGGAKSAKSNFLRIKNWRLTIYG